MTFDLSENLNADDVFLKINVYLDDNSTVSKNVTMSPGKKQLFLKYQEKDIFLHNKSYIMIMHKISQSCQSAL